MAVGGFLDFKRQAAFKACLSFGENRNWRLHSYRALQLLSSRFESRPKAFLKFTKLSQQKPCVCPKKWPKCRTTQHSAAPVLRTLSQMQFWATLTWKRSQLGRLWSFPLRLQSFSTCSAQSDAKLAFTFALKARALSYVNNLSHYIFAHRQSVFDLLWIFSSVSFRLPSKWLNFFTASMNGYGERECSKENFRISH